jgi:hypothetical protein
VSGALTVHAESAPVGVTAADIVVPDGMSDGKLTLSASAATTPGATGDVVIDLLAGKMKEDSKALKIALSGKPGELDTTWGSMGVADIAVSPGNAGVTDSLGHDVAVYPASAGANAGKVVALARVTLNGEYHGVLLRFDTAGNLDTTFGDKLGGARMGYTVFDLDVDVQGALSAVRVAIDSLGRIVAANTIWEGVCPVRVERFTVDGDVDDTFPTFVGKFNQAYCGQFNAMTLAKNDDVVLLARWGLYGGDAEAVIQILNANDGSKGAYYPIQLDTNEEATTFLQALTIDSHGRYVLAGQQCVGGWESMMYKCKDAIVRLSKDGTLDLSLGAPNGYTLFDFGVATYSDFWGPLDLNRGVTVDAKDNPLAVGQNGSGTLATMRMVNANDGSPMASFGNNGSVLRDLLPGSSEQGFRQALIDEEGRTLSLGWAVNNGADNNVRTRTNAKGDLDLSYATNGVGVTPVKSDGPGALAPDQRLYVVGTVPRNGSGMDVAVFRYWP